MHLDGQPLVLERRVLPPHVLMLHLLGNHQHQFPCLPILLGIEYQQVDIAHHTVQRLSVARGHARPFQQHRVHPFALQLYHQLRHKAVHPAVLILQVHRTGIELHDLRARTVVLFRQRRYTVGHDTHHRLLLRQLVHHIPVGILLKHRHIRFAAPQSGLQQLQKHPFILHFHRDSAAKIVNLIEN